MTVLGMKEGLTRVDTTMIQTLLLPKLAASAKELKVMETLKVAWMTLQ